MVTRCEDCPYYFKEENEKHPRCYFTDWRGEPSWLDVPPCEEEDYEDDYDYNDDWDGDNADYEMGYDPYLGCFTDDC